MENTENLETGSRKRYTPEFKLEAGGKTGNQIERDLGIANGQLYKWRKELASQGRRAFPGNGNSRDEELARLRKECATLREERDILRKAVAISPNRRDEVPFHLDATKRPPRGADGQGVGSDAQWVLRVGEFGAERSRGTR